MPGSTRDGPAFAPKSAFSGLAWPPVPDLRGLILTSLLVQYEQSQWWSPERLEAAQFAQLELLLAHSYQVLPYYKERLDAAGYRPKQELTWDIWSKIPILKRRTLQEEAAALTASTIPKGHGKTFTRSSSGSSGRPVKVVASELSGLFRDSCMLRDILWHRIDVGGKLAAIRGRNKAATFPDGLSKPTWDPTVDSVFSTGPGAALTSVTPVPQQADWLQRQDPDYLVIMPHNLFALAEHCRMEGIRLGKLQGVSTYGGVVRPEDREACRAAWDVEIFDVYSAEEPGYMAIQCPEFEHYHVQSEAALVEVLDEDGRTCQAGEVGRVIVTPLHNFAMPLLRYDLGDMAEVGQPCACGRGLPVIKRFVGRTRDMLTLPTGEQVSPSFVNDAFRDLPVAQYQIIQDAPDHLQVKLVPEDSFEAAEQEPAIRAMLTERLPAAYGMTFSYHEKIEHTPGGKYYDFRSEITKAE